MAGLWKSISDNYRWLMDEKSDPRVNNWFLMSSPFPTLFICLSYAYFVKVLGPKIMENRKPFTLRKVLLVYNFFQVLLSTWLFHEALASGWWNDYSFRCQPVDYSNKPKALRMAAGSWWYFISKFTEFWDTFFFVLRKKNNQITTLHVIHHGIMPMSTWVGVKFLPGGHASFFGLLNTFVHIVMYGYYYLAALGPQIQPYLWWKKYLTTLQMVQFILVMVHAFQLLFIECDFPKPFAYWIGCHAILFFFLFRDFYVQSYTKKRARDAAALKMNTKKTDKTEDNYAQNLDKSKKETGVLYPNQYKMATGYISDNGLRNRAFIDNHVGE
ncbi:elongation of very long chain fatty acids protein AAEL008004-like [Chelonus insularis]|uniref:elongation of very long chain fatty acids protein AAEL008004-like n=1 Tax=Chelonus insularis TaxID=460826 RepID=UPI00158F3F2D|nr:elongation of very long chain fatty acids protein AAEL008004-like [Chelonus insularis]XP_034946032.1 elongation of very long chain fatty acids protein AAEL008004-like [Chelonus insularis]